VSGSEGGVYTRQVSVVTDWNVSFCALELYFQRTRRFAHPHVFSSVIWFICAFEMGTSEFEAGKNRVATLFPLFNDDFRCVFGAQKCGDAMLVSLNCVWMYRQTLITTLPSLAPMEACELRFPIVRYFHLPPSPIYRHKLRRADSGVVSGVDCIFYFANNQWYSLSPPLEPPPVWDAVLSERWRMSVVCPYKIWIPSLTGDIHGLLCPRWLQ
jgi:hypothetical protein